MYTITKKGNFNLHKLRSMANIVNMDNLPGQPSVRKAFKQITKEICNEEGDLWACPDLCMVLWTFGYVDLSKNTYEDALGRPNMIGFWNGKKVFIERNFLTEWELRKYDEKR